MRNWQRPLVDFVREARGSIAVEFALIFPVFILLMMGGVELSFLVYTGSSMQNAARDTARKLALGTLAYSAAKANIDAAIPQWAIGSYTISVVDSDPGDKSKNAITLTLGVTGSKAVPLKFLTQSTIFNFNIKVVMKQEDLT